MCEDIKLEDCKIHFKQNISWINFQGYADSEQIGLVIYTTLRTDVFDSNFRVL